MKGKTKHEACVETARVFTIGYEGKTFTSFVERLRNTHVRVVVDVRELPLSRKKGFSKTALKGLLAQEGIDYVSLRPLGAPRPVRRRLYATGDYDGFFAAYRGHLGQQAETLATLESFIAESSVCLMCFEADPRQCHRSQIALELRNRHRNELEVKHL